MKPVQQSSCLVLRHFFVPSSESCSIPKIWPSSWAAVCNGRKQLTYGYWTKTHFYRWKIFWCNIYEKIHSEKTFYFVIITPAVSRTPLSGPLRMPTLFSLHTLPTFACPATPDAVPFGKLVKIWNACTPLLLGR